ncbi:hypothetical protein BMF94_6606 [Rhodotorula taiwanensis]|uniref:Yeast cell wall synthesis Kre9/Knh1-like N-terminal domain-containing protein n=1 Tax=Rhodotorula taiwanensis TaxID=741276 RepID=A0A2S5B0N1_9BASI|nr:hypothetical protein BMF94_6606 [Rhodotorula taiwanensis]
MRSVTQLRAAAAVVALSAATAVLGDVVPTAPGPGEVFRVGQKCNIQWNLDTTGTWTSFEIQLMTGSNLAMVPVQTVATGIDGTTGAGTIDFTCPSVTPNSAIYFYQYTQAGAPTAWTTRFTIAAADGSTTPPTDTTAGIAWGTGQLVGQANVASLPASSAAVSSAAASASASVPVANSKSRASAAVATSSIVSTSASTTTATTTTTAPSSTFVTSVTSSSSASPIASGLTSLSPAAVVVTVTSQSAAPSGSAGAVNANVNGAAGRAMSSVTAALLGGVAFAAALFA